ncbi:MAG: Ig-like domain-containing protein, partial [Candidatus Bipolaricaulaceae bacterium]
PVAVDDAYEVWEDGTLEAGVLHNDLYPSELPCFLKIVKGTKFGDLQFNSYTGNFVYTPLPNFYGKDIFEYELCCDGACDTAEVTLEVLPRNDPVRGEDVDVRTCTGKAVGFALIAYDADIPAEDFQDHPLRFEVIHGPSYGTLTADWTNVAYQAGRAVLHAVYAPDPGFVGEDALVVRVSDIFGDTDYLRVRVKVDDCRRGEVALGPVVIHEIAWAGTPASPEDQWIELRNLTDESVALTGWTLRWRKKEPKTEEDMIWREIRLSGVIQARGFFLLERGHDEVVRDIPADLIYPATIRVGEWEIPLLFSPEGDAVMLVNAAGAVVDTANADPRRPRGWAAGDFATKASMERKAPYLPDRDENWWTNLGLVTHGLDRKGQEIRGTANALNEPELLACQEPPLEVASGEKVTLIRALRVVPKAFPRAVLVRMEGDLPVAALPAGDRLAVHLDATLGLVNVVLDTTGLQPGVYHLVVLLAQNRPLMARLQIR